MNEPPVSPQSGEIPNLPSASVPQSAFPDESVAPAEGRSLEEPEGYRRRRSGRREEKSSAHKNHRGAHRSKGIFRGSSHERHEKGIVAGCFLLGAISLLIVGFLCGQKYGGTKEPSHHDVQQGPDFPLPATETLLDAAFEALGEGNSSQALLDFQKVQEAQPSLVGIDYLIAESAWKAGEQGLAEDAVSHAISKNEFADEARVLLALMRLGKTSGVSETGQFADPSVNAESAIRSLAAGHPGNARIYAIWGDFLRSNGSYRMAAETLHKGVLRSDPLAARELLSAKEQLARLQNEPAKTAPSLSPLTAMTGEQALVAALASLQQHQDEDAVTFLQRAQDLYSPQIFRELMKDAAFNEYSTNLRLRSFLKPDHTPVSLPGN